MDQKRAATRSERRPATLIVRLWHRPEGFRADVRPLHARPGDARFFRSLGALLDHLAALDRDPDHDPDGDPDDGSPEVARPRRPSSERSEP